jgi:hypothetical protein
LNEKSPDEFSTEPMENAKNLGARPFGLHTTNAESAGHVDLELVIRGVN